MKTYLFVVVVIFGFFWVMDVTGVGDDTRTASAPSPGLTAVPTVDPDPPASLNCDQIKDRWDQNDCYDYEALLWWEWEKRNPIGGYPGDDVRCYPMVGCK
jgi:hypothetical protein